VELLTLSEQVEAIRSGSLRAVEAVSGYLTRSEKSQDRLNAYTALHAERALAEAERIDRMIAAGDDPGPLSGAAIAVKDLIDQAGQVTTCGSAFYRRRADRSAVALARLEAAGAVVIGRTGLHEFAYGFSSENEWFGPVRNPWDPDTSPGGSSGGSAVAASADLAAGAIGTDTGGSIRVPAALCGVFGLKATHGRVPLTGVFPLASSLDTVGPLTRSVEDTALLYLTMAGYELSDPWSAPIPVETPDLDHASVADLVAGVPQPWVDQAPAARDVRDAFDRALRRLEELGVRIEEVREPELLPPGLAYELISGEVATVHRRWFEDPDKQYGVEVAARLSETLDVTLDQYVAAHAWQARLRNVARSIFDRVHVLVTPTVPALRKVIGEDRMDIDDQQLSYRFVLSWFVRLVNHLGVPSLAAPLAVGGSPPPSLQFIGPWWSEDRLLEIGRFLEKAGVLGYRPPDRCR
jgi:aspartyl-tRNA(Asn)/glutamyl-tRNA(Gln) amidotransferase subunit A